MTDAFCPCGSGDTLDACCGRYHDGAPAPTAEKLMRSRYSAYVLCRIDYLCKTTLPAQQAGLDMTRIRHWSVESTWLGLSIEEVELIAGIPEHARVVFSVRWHDGQNERVHYENAGFVQIDSRWYFLDPTVRLKTKRNDLCPCGSGNKTKKCCGPWIH